MASEIPMPRSRRSIVTKSNALIGAKYELSLVEHRVILACAAQLDGRKLLPKDNQFTVTARSFAEMFEVPLCNAYVCLANAANALFDRDIARIGGTVQQRMRWVYMVEYRSGEGRIVLGFSPTIAPYLTRLNRQFTSYCLSDIRTLSSTNSIRLYEMLIQFRNTGVFSIALDELRERLIGSQKYPRYSNFRQRIISPTVCELNQKTSLEVEVIEVKEGRRVARLEFGFRDSSPANKKAPIEGEFAESKAVRRVARLKTWVGDKKSNISALA